MPRTCTHIKTNGIKCGTFALRHHTKCYFHYQWERREQRRVRLGGPVGMNKNTGIELPILDSPAAILLAIMEIQHALLDSRIDHKSASTLLYSIQLAIQVQPNESSLGSHTRGVLECPELDNELEMERARGLRPSAEVCDRCPKQVDCTSPSACRKLPKSLPRVKQATIPNSPPSRPERKAPPLLPSSRPEARSAVVEACPERSRRGPAVTGAPAARPLFPETISDPSVAVPVDLADPGRSRSRKAATSFCHADEPSDEASLSTPPPAGHSTPSLREGSPARECGVNATLNLHESRKARRENQFPTPEGASYPFQT